MQEALNHAFTLMGQGMAGIFVVMILIALIVAFLGRITRAKS